MLNPFSTTGVGSLPHRNAEDACRLILETFDIPFWPQLPRVSFREFMIPQYAEGMPFFRIDDEKQAVWVERSDSDELERFYESCTENARIAISQDYAAGLHVFLHAIKNRTLSTVKGQVTGPLTFTLGLKDSGGKPVYFDEELREVSLMLLKAKTRWQMDILKARAGRVVLFIDEPILSALGSSGYLGVSSEEALRLLKEICSTVIDEGGIPGIHCCGNADWPLAMNSGVTLLNFDAYDYIDTLCLYPSELKEFFDRGGILAWGAVPTSDAIAGENFDSIRERFDSGMEKLARHVPDSIIRSRILLTPSCGTGSRTVEETVKIFQFLIRLKEEVS